MNKVMLILAAGLIVSAAAAEDADGIKGKIGLGLDTASGNSEVVALTADLGLNYRRGADVYELGAAYGYAETDNEVSRQNSLVSLRYDRTLSERLYAYLRSENAYDKIALIDYRLTVGPGAGVFFIRSDSVSLKGDVGVSYIDQKLRDDSLANNYDSVTALRLTERLEVKLSETASIWQSAEYLPDTDEFDSYLLNLEAGLETSITGATSLRLVTGSRRQSKPPEGVEKEDITVRAMITVSLGSQ